MNVVLGASLPGFLVAEHLAEREESVLVVAGNTKRRPRSESGLGPQYLWATPKVLEYFQKRHIYIEQMKVSVHWSRLGKCISSRFVEGKDLETYMAKVPSKTLPCQGLTEFFAVYNGFYTLLQYLEQVVIKRKISILRQDVLHINPWMKILLAGRARLSYDALYNTLDRRIYQSLVDAEAIESRNLPTYFYGSSQRLHALDEPVREDESRFDYLYDDSPFFRASWSRQRKMWVYESTQALEDCPFKPEFVECLEAKIIDKRPFPEHDVVRHVGRWARYDPELMVSDVIADLSSICA